MHVLNDGINPAKMGENYAGNISTTCVSQSLNLLMVISTTMAVSFVLLFCRHCLAALGRQKFDAIAKTTPLYSGLTYEDIR